MADERLMVVGWGPFRIWGERRRLKRAREEAERLAAASRPRSGLQGDAYAAAVHNIFGESRPMPKDDPSPPADPEGSRP